MRTGVEHFTDDDLISHFNRITESIEHALDAQAAGLPSVMHNGRLQAAGTAAFGAQVILQPFLRELNGRGITTGWEFTAKTDPCAS